MIDNNKKQKLDWHLELGTQGLQVNIVKQMVQSDADSTASECGGDSCKRQRYNEPSNFESGEYPHPDRNTTATGQESSRTPVRTYQGYEVLQILEQPAKFARFRYQAEGRQNCLMGRMPGNPPTVAINPALRHFIPDGTMVHVTPVTRFNDSNGRCVPHWHSLEGRDGEPTDQPLCDGKAEFASLVVKRHRSSVRHNVDDQRAVRLRFTVSFMDNLGEFRTAEAISDSIFSTELKIDRISHDHGNVHGGTQLIILCSKIQRRTTMIRLRDTAQSSWIPPIESGWTLDMNSFPTYIIQPNDLETHHQFAVTATMPPYHILGITESRTVKIQLIDTSNDIESDSVLFKYCPPKPERLQPKVKATQAEPKQKWSSTQNPYQVLLNSTKDTEESSAACRQNYRGSQKQTNCFLRGTIDSLLS